MSLFSEYLTDLQGKLETLVPADTSYSVRVVDEYSVRETITDNADTILCVVRWGAATKPVTDQHMVIQPMTFTVWSEGDGFEATKAIFSAFFSAYAKTTMTLDGKTIIADYSSPVLMGTPQTINGVQRWMFVVSGTLYYSEDLLIGMTVTLNGEEIHPLAVMSAYNTQPITPQVYGAATGKVLIQGANNTISLNYYARDNAFDADLIGASHGAELTNSQITFGISYGAPAHTVSVPCVVTGLQTAYDQQIKRLTITINLMPRI